MRLQPLEGSGARLGFGCAALGDVLDYAAKCRLIEAAYEAGFRHFDTAPSYGHGDAEAVLATVLGSVRDKVSITTKTGIAHPKAAGAMKTLRRLAAPIKSMLPGLWRAASRNAQGVVAPTGRFDPAQIEASVAESLRRLRSDKVDALLLHEVHAADLAPETLATLDGLVARGHADALGTGTGVNETVRIAAAHPLRFQAFQVNHYWGARMPALAVAGSAVITHRCIRTGLELLAEPALRNAMAAHVEARELLAACADTRRSAELMLAAALQVRGLGMVLVSSSKAERVRQFVALTRRSDLQPLATAMNECLDAVAVEDMISEAANRR